MNDPQSRLERARFQYENLLLHAGNTLLLATTPPRSISPSTLRLGSGSKRSPTLEELRGRSPLANNLTSNTTSPFLKRGKD